MTIERREIPEIPVRRRVHPTTHRIGRSYPVGRQSISRALQGETLSLTITSNEPIPGDVQANIVTTLNAGIRNRETANPSTSVEESLTITDSPAGAGESGSQTYPFVRIDDRTLTCRLTPEHPGFHSFRAEFSRDQGVTWLRDNAPDAWILIDPPQVDALRLYSLIPAVSGTIADWKADLKRIRAMGFNAVHLLPVTAMDASESPYSAKDLFDIDHRYLVMGAQSPPPPVPEGERTSVSSSSGHSDMVGSSSNFLGKSAGSDGLEQLEGFIEGAKSLNIQLCFDLVLNHVGATSTMALRAPDWIVPDQSQTDGFRRARYWTDGGWKTWNDLVLINYEHPSEMIRSEIWAYMIDYALFWAKYADYTGGFVRFDNLHSSNPEFVQALTKALHSELPEVAVVAEYFTDEVTLLRTGPQWGLNLVLATPWSYKFVAELRTYLNYIHRVSNHVRYYMPITSHDSGSPAQEFGTADSTIPRYVAAALLGTGATGMPQGVELGERERVDFIGREAKMVFPSEPRFAPIIGQVNAILAEHRAFRCGGNCEFVDSGHDAIIAAFRRDPRDEAGGFLVVCNFDTRSQQGITIDLNAFLGAARPTEFSDLLAGKTQAVSSELLGLWLPPCSAQVLMFAR